MSIYCSIMAGGVGTRFWPLSTSTKPKQCLSFDGKKSLIQHTVSRARLFNSANISDITGPTMQEAIEAQLSNEQLSILVEPTPRNTFPCFLWSLIQARKKGLEKIIIWPSDHDIFPDKDWIASHEIGLEATNFYDLIVIGIEPYKPYTGYGYIETGELSSNNVYRAHSFHEKPSADKAKAYLESGNFLWNSGVIIANVSNLISLIEKLYPTISRHFSSLEDERVSEQTWERLLNTSFDYAVLEKSQNIGIVRSNVQWNDLGSWDSIRHLLQKNGTHLTNDAPIISIDSNDCMFYSATNKRVSLIGVENLIIVETDTEILIMDSKMAQKVRTLSKFQSGEKQ